MPWHCRSHGDIPPDDVRLLTEASPHGNERDEFGCLLDFTPPAREDPGMTTTASTTEPAGAPVCERCEAKPAVGECCSSHRKQLCHEDYRRTHWVEVCIDGCQHCQDEGLPLVLRATIVEVSPGWESLANQLATAVDQVASTIAADAAGGAR